MYISKSTHSESSNVMSSSLLFEIIEIITTNGLCRVKYEYNSISHSTLKHVELNNIGHVWYKACRIFISQCLNKIFIRNSSILIHLCITKFLKIKESKISRDDILTKCLSNSQHWAWKFINLKYFLWMLAIYRGSKVRGMATYDRTGTAEFSSCKLEHILK